MFYEKHQATLDAALDACATRKYWSPFTESPSRALHAEGAHEAGKAAFEALLGKPFELVQPGEVGRTGQEISPYTQQALGIDYPKVDVDAVMAAAGQAMQSWKKVPPGERVGLCLEMAFALEQQCFVNAYATMHTAGQAFLMAYSGSGPNALDRGVEALAYAHKAMADVPESASWSKAFGKAGDVTLNKSYRLMPRGVAVVVCCATFPMWNAYPAIFANLATGNPVIVKPHPNGILPVAIAARTMRQVLQDNGQNPDVLIMAADTREEPVTVELLQHADTAIVDYTGSQQFGRWIEQNCAGRQVFTETAGCNAVVVHSTDNLDGLIAGLANSLCGFSAQMCTSPQNIHIPADGIESDEGHLSFDAFCERLTATISARVADPNRAAAMCGAIQAEQSLDILARLRSDPRVRVALDTHGYEHPDFPQARTATPLVLVAGAADRELYAEEHFAPVSFLIKEESADAALDNATQLARTRGAISSYLYSADGEFSQRAREAFADAGASLWCNMTVPMPINFAAAYSDYHVTGLNPAGNACLADLAFVANRFRIVQFREPA
ncbi:MAG: phenylacetic acid degradation protein PaaN [Woeseiaceae bacterium]|nr:phenylacetic acid degradation protein PaaN [Woeseiaceae bacterium]